MGKISCADRDRNEEAVQRVKGKINILQTRKSRKANWIGYILLRHCLLKHIIEGKIERRIEVNTRWGRRRKQLLGDLKDRTGCGKLKEKAPDRALWRTRFGRGCGPLVRESIEWMFEYTNERLNEWTNEGMKEGTKGLQIPAFFGAESCWLVNTVNWGWVKNWLERVQKGKMVDSF